MFPVWPTFLPLPHPPSLRLSSCFFSSSPQLHSQSAASPASPPLALSLPASSAADSDSDGDVEAAESLRLVVERFNARVSSKDEWMQQQQRDEQQDEQRASKWDAKADSDGDEAASDSTARSPSLSRRQQRIVSRLSLSELKALTATPGLVELHDTNSPDPCLLVALKAVNNAVSVPPHWRAKRKYLANKRGYEKPPFALPAFLADTGIANMRGVQLSKEADRTSKQKQRERMRPKMGAIDIDYNTLHDAFFRYQTKPQLTAHGDLYYEGKEFESGMQSATPLHYSQQLMEAVGMAASESPPPWLSAMQRYGPPPAYPFLRVPGVNGPLPAGQRWGLSEGEWGKPPVDDAGRPLWGGELFGEAKHSSRERKLHQPHWGHVQTNLDDGDEEEEGTQAEEQASHDEADSEQPEATVAGSSAGLLSGVSGVLPSGGLSTPAAINLRKYADGAGTETPNTVHSSTHTPQLFTVLDERPIMERGSGLLPLTHTYHISAVDEQQHAAVDRRAGGGVELSLDPADLDSLDAPTLKRKYEQQQQRQQRQLQTAGDEEDDDEPGSTRSTGTGSSSISKEVDETARKKRRKESQPHKFKF